MWKMVSTAAAAVSRNNIAKARKTVQKPVLVINGSSSAQTSTGRTNAVGGAVKIINHMAANVIATTLIAAVRQLIVGITCMK